MAKTFTGRRVFNGQHWSGGKEGVCTRKRGCGTRLVGIAQARRGTAAKPTTGRLHPARVQACSSQLAPGPAPLGLPSNHRPAQHSPSRPVTVAPPRASCPALRPCPWLQTPATERPWPRPATAAGLAQVRPGRGRAWAVGGRLPFPLSPSAARSGRKKPRQSPWAAWQKLRMSTSRAPWQGSSSNTSGAKSSPSGWLRGSHSKGSSPVSSPTTRSASLCS